MLDCVDCPAQYTYADNQCKGTVGGALSPTFASMATNAFSHKENI